ncbi:MULTISPECIES: hypothetical protein [unclassified Shigella]|uniref:hypothetical protein n=1 Tax=unclassified Shigella TaxID=2629414 RepID=UPI0008481B4B|nr:MULTISPECIES: hypothetical protein [unclassified Shigella]ODQ07176.1 hypothetical protein BGK50_01685 [Shigella sp. FC130]OEI94572.1 hypothetical protein BHE86_01700 [Shigella sp. FC1655]OEJ02989.1 hypothetical protein BHE89_08270 [Shigella sp. FC1967]
MASYLVRIEIYDADIDDYNSLHESMEFLHMYKYFDNNEGVRKDLPDGTYVGNSGLSAVNLRNEINKFANPLSSQSPSIFVCEFSNWASLLYPHNTKP